MLATIQEHQKWISMNIRGIAFYKRKEPPTQNLHQQTVQGICFSAKNGHLETQTRCCKETVEVAHAPASAAIDPNKSLGVASVF
jgi:hypothetical protein